MLAWCKDRGVSNAANPRTQTVHVLEKQSQEDHQVGFVELFASEKNSENFTEKVALMNNTLKHIFPAATIFILSHQSVLEIEIKKY